MESAALASYLEGKNVLVTGGTGSFGNQSVSELVKYKPRRVTVLSRDEKKQYDMQHAYAGHSNMRFVIGDVRNLECLRETFRAVDIVIHAAALKQVPNTEAAPFEAVETNIVGAENVRRAAIEAGVHTVIAISTDKAVKPVNVMGMTKAIQERLFLNPRNADYKTRFVCVRYGNVVGSRGSVIPLFRNKILEGAPLPVTHPDMTRFLLTLPQAVNLVFKAMLDGESGDLFVRRMPAARVVDIGRILALGITGRKDYPQHVVGVRPGEKIHEVLVSEEEMRRAERKDEFYLIRSPGWNASAYRSGSVEEYSSLNTDRLPDGELLELLRSEGWCAPTGETVREQY